MFRYNSNLMNITDRDVIHRLVALQSIPAKFIPPSLNIGVRWINTPTYTDYACRIHRDLVPFPADPRLATVELPRIFSGAKPASPDESDKAAGTTQAPPPGTVKQ